MDRALRWALATRPEPRVCSLANERRQDIQLFLYHQWNLGMIAANVIQSQVQCRLQNNFLQKQRQSNKNPSNMQ